MAELIVPGSAYKTWLAALAEHGKAVRERQGEARCQCPWGLHRTGGNLPLKLTRTPIGVNVHCFGFCNTEDIARQLSLPWPYCLYDNPARKRPTRNECRRAIKKAGFTRATRDVYLDLVERADNTTALIPDRFQPGSQRAWAKELDMAVSTLEVALGQLRDCGWVSTTCRREGCDRPGTHQGEGHRARYIPDIGEPYPAANRGRHGRSTERRYISPPAEVPIPGPRSTDPLRVSAAKTQQSTEDIRKERGGPPGRGEGAGLKVIEGGKSRKRPGRPRNDRSRTEVLRMRAEGWPLERIADTLGQPLTTVYRITARADHAAEHGVPYEAVRDCARCRKPCHGPVRLCQRHGGAA